MRNVPVRCAELLPKLGPTSAPAKALVSVLTAGLLYGPGAALPGVGAGSAWAQGATASGGKSDEAVARNLYREAKELKAAGKLSLALEKYREAYQALPTPTLLWPIAELSLQLGQPVEGLEALQHYRQSLTPALMEPGQQLPDVERLEKRLLERQGQVRFSGGNGVLVALDGRELGRAPLSEPVAVNPGSHRIDSTTAHGTQTTVVEIGPGQELAVNLTDGASADGGSKAAGDTTRYRIHPLPAVLLGVSSGMLAAATVLGGLALDKTTTLNGQCQDHVCLGMQGMDIGPLNDLVVSQRNFSTAAITLWGVGGVLLAGGLILLAVDVQRHRSGHKLWTLAPQLGISSSGVTSGMVWGGRF